MSQGLSRAAIAMLARLNGERTRLTPESPTHPARGVYACHTIGESVKLVGLDHTGAARVSFEVGDEDFDPAMVTRMERWLDNHYPVPEPAASNNKLAVVR